MTITRASCLLMLTLSSVLAASEQPSQSLPETGPARHFVLPADNADLVGSNRTVTTSSEDTLIDIAARYQLGYNLIRSANPDVDPWLPGEGTPVVLPASTLLPASPRQGIVINAPEMRLYYFTPARTNQPRSVTVYPISIGRGDWSTPITTTRVVSRAKDPIWYPPKSIRAEHAARGDILPMQVPPGPDNPLGRYLLALDIPGYFIHGTNRRFGIGMQVTHGCIRMYPKDIEQLVKTVANNTEVTIINQPVKTGWHNGELFLEIHPPLEGDPLAGKLSTSDVIAALVQATRHHPDTVIAWDKLEDIIAARQGVPQQVGYLPQQNILSES